MLGIKELKEDTEGYRRMLHPKAIMLYETLETKLALLFTL